VGHQIELETGQWKGVHNWFTAQGTKRGAEKKLAELLHS
jgi:hypothetical protein